MQGSRRWRAARRATSGTTARRSASAPARRRPSSPLPSSLPAASRSACRGRRLRLCAPATQPAAQLCGGAQRGNQPGAGHLALGMLRPARTAARTSARELPRARRPASTLHHARASRYAALRQCGSSTLSACVWTPVSARGPGLLHVPPWACARCPAAAHPLAAPHRLRCIACANLVWLIQRALASNHCARI